MLKVKLEVCTGCTSELADTVAHLRQEHEDWLEVIERESLDACQGSVPAVKLDGTAILLGPGAVSTLQERVVHAVTRRARRCTRCRARVCSGICAP